MPQPSRGGFTLVELLVVIVIVAVLSFLSFSLVERGRASADRATCLTSMRQFGVATAAYIDDNNGALPGPISANGQTPHYSTGGGNIFSRLHPYLGLPETYSVKGLSDSLCCAAFRRKNPGWNANGGGALAGRAYVMNQDQVINGRRVFGPQVAHDPIRNTMRYASISDGTRRTPLQNMPMLSDYGDVHGKVRNILFLDYHVESRPLSYPVNGLP